AAAAGRWVQITVSDSGPGIAPEHLPHLFERFYRVEAARGADSGAGLGLAIAQSLMTAQGGRIEIHSQVGQGTQVVLRLPAQTYPPSACSLSAAPFHLGEP